MKADNWDGSVDVFFGRGPVGVPLYSSPHIKV